MKKNRTAIIIGLCLAVSGAYAQSNTVAERDVNSNVSSSKGEAARATSETRNKAVKERTQLSKSPHIRSLQLDYKKEQNWHQAKKQKQIQRMEQADQRHQARHKKTTQAREKAQRRRQAQYEERAQQQLLDFHNLVSEHHQEARHLQKAQGR